MPAVVSPRACGCKGSAMLRARNLNVAANRNPNRRRSRRRRRSGKLKMSMISGAGVVVPTVLLGSAAIVHATENEVEGSKSRFGGIHRTPDHSRHDTASIMQPRQTPIGHRQPRVSDIPAATQLSPLDGELRQEDEKIEQ